MKKFSAILTGVLALSLVGLPTGTFADAGFDEQQKPFETIAPELAAVYGLMMCASDVELDCIDSVSTKGPNGAFTAATLSDPENWNYLVNDLGEPIPEENGNFAFRNSVGFQYLDENGDPQDFSISGELETPAHIIYSGIDGDVLGGALRIYANNLGDRVLQVKVRTSWLKPQNIQLVAEEANFETEALTNGNLWTFEGKSTAVTSYSDWDAAFQNGLMDAGDVSTIELHFFIHHAGIDSGHSYFPPDCSDEGFTVQAFNSNSAGSPEWNTETGSLDFNIFAPHLNTNNELNQGFFKLWVNDEFVNCRWPENTLTKFDRLTAKVLNEDGTEQAGVSVTTTHIDGQITLATEGFHYSSPTIQLKGLKKPRKPAVEILTQMPLPPNSADLELQPGLGSLVVKVNYSGLAHNEPETHAVNISPGGKGCVIHGSSSSCEVSGLTKGVEYSVSISATNKFGTSAKTALPAKYMLSEAGLVKYESTKIIPNFAGGSAKLTKAFKLALKKYVSANTGLSAVSCTGYTAGKPVIKSDKVLAKARAKAVCAYIRTIAPEISTTVIGKSPGLTLAPANRKVVVRGYSAIGE